MSDSDVELLPGLWGKLPEIAGMILGTEVSVGKRSVERGFETPEKVYCASLKSKNEDDETPRAWVVFELGVAAAAGGVLVMRPDDIIKERVAEGKLEDDDLDAMGEFVNQLAAPLNDSLKAMELDDTPHFAFNGGGTDETHRPEGSLIAFGSSIEIGGNYKGNFWLVLDRAIVEEPEDEGAGDGGGVELSPEELEAIRAATQAAVDAIGRTLFVVPLAREREAWTKLLGDSDIEYEFAKDLAGLRRAVAAGSFSAVVVDADACPAGGLPYLAASRDARGRLPAVVVASAPTRTHLVSCVAAGAAAYLSKPLEPSKLLESVESVRRYDS